MRGELAASQTPTCWPCRTQRGARRESAGVALLPRVAQGVLLPRVLPRLARSPLLVTLLTLFAAPAAFAENFDYDSRRPAEIGVRDHVENPHRAFPAAARFFSA